MFSCSHFPVVSFVCDTISVTLNQDMFIGASETSNITAEWAMAQLLRRPDKMERLPAEIAASLGAKEFVEEGDLGSLPCPTSTPW